MNFKNWLRSSILIFLSAVVLAAVPAFSEDAGTASSSAAAEKEKALKNPYPNDLGPDKLADISKYSAEQQQGYKLMQDKCSKCHTPSRPLNSQFLDLKKEEMEQIRKSNPEIFKDKLVWQVEEGIWQRYIKRMMAKPGCGISTDEGKKIWKFIVEYSKREKTGAQAAKWAQQRRKLLADFKAKYPDKYKELFEK